MQNYIKQHFARMGGIWEVECITDELWAKTYQVEQQIDNGSIFNQSHNSSKIQQYAKSCMNRKEQINHMGGDIGEVELRRAIQKLSNRKSVGSGEITTEIAKIDAGWITPTLKVLFNNIGRKMIRPVVGMEE